MSGPRGTVRVSGSSGLARLYWRWWEMNRWDLPSGYKENLCHFFWTSIWVLIQILWFGFWTYRLVGPVRPWTVVFTAMSLVGYAILFAFFLPVMAITTTAVVGVILGLGLLFILTKIGALGLMGHWIAEGADGIADWWDREDGSAARIRSVLIWTDWLFYQIGRVILLGVSWPVRLTVRYLRRHPRIWYHTKRAAQMIGLAVVLGVTFIIRYVLFLPGKYILFLPVKEAVHAFLAWRRSRAETRRVRQKWAPAIPVPPPPTRRVTPVRVATVPTAKQVSRLRRAAQVVGKAAYYLVVWPVKQAFRFAQRKRLGPGTATVIVATGRGVGSAASHAVVEPGLGLLGVLWAMLVATKHMLCPLIEIVEEPATS